jgi:hypothetical protein
MRSVDQPHRISLAVAALVAGLVLGGCGAGDDDTHLDVAGTTGPSDADDDDAVRGDDAAATTTRTAPATDEEAAATTTDDGSGEEAEALYPDVIAVTASEAGNGTWNVSATLSSPYDSPERYADAWRVLGPDGTVYGIRELAHDHAGEQPFTRSLSSVEIPDDVDEITIEGRDQVSGWGGATVTITLER